MRPVVEEIVSHGKNSTSDLRPDRSRSFTPCWTPNIDDNALILCSGYKDVEFIELALLAQKMGRHIFIVVEKIHELVLIASVAKRLKIRPNVGIRIKLSSTGSGKWGGVEGGDQSKFGLSSSELLEALDILEKNKLHRLSQADTLPHRQSGHQDTPHQKRSARGHTVLRAALASGLHEIG